MPKRRIVVLGWAWLPFQHMEGTGYNLVASELCAALASRGHEVTYLRSGHTYSLRRSMRIERGEVWRGVPCHDLINAPIVAPAHFGFRAPGVQCSHTEHTAMVVAFVKRASAEIVHIHSLEGFALEVVAALRAASIAVVVTPHNYYALCPQVDLMSRERETCLDYEGGLRCEGCIDRPPASEEIARRRSRHSVDRTLGPKFGMTMKTAMLRIGARAGLRSAPEDTSPHALVTEPAAMPISDPATTDRLIANRDVHLACVNEYGQRRAAGVAALNAASLVLCPSRVLLEIHASMGVSRDRLVHVPLGLPHIDAMRRAAENSAFVDRLPWSHDQASRPLRMNYYGSTKPNKGLGTLVRAITSLPAAVLSRCHFDLFAPGDAAEVGAMRAKIELHTHAQVRWFGSYEPRDLAASVGTYEVGLLPNMGLENSPLVLLEYLAAGAWVIASDLGASREWVKPGENGTLVPAGDCAALAHAIAGVVEGRVALPPVRRVHASTPFVRSAEYVDDVEARHEAVLESPRT